MRRILLQSAAFVRAARRLVKTHPEAALLLQAALPRWTGQVAPSHRQ